MSVTLWNKVVFPVVGPGMRNRLGAVVCLSFDVSAYTVGEYVREGGRDQQQWETRRIGPPEV